MTSPQWDQSVTPLTDGENVMFVLVDPAQEKLRPAAWTPDDGLVPKTDELLQAAADVHEGAMIAFVMRPEDAQRLAIDGGEPVEQLHTTSVYLGDAVDIDAQTRMDIIEMMVDCANGCEPIVANVFGFAILNPDGPEPCLVANVGGQELWDVQEMICEIADSQEWTSADAHAPWLAHITLIYEPDPRVSLTDDVLSRTGPIIYDRIRVAFGGVVTDIPLGVGILQADAFVRQAFHMPGKHNQATHGRGGASSAELSAGERLNAGKDLDMSDPEQAAIAGSIHTWAATSTSSTGKTTGDQAKFRSEIADAMQNPHADTPGARFTRTVAGAPATAPVLHRGLADVPDHQIPHEGDVFDIGPTSFSADRGIAEEFARPAFHDLVAGTMVTMRVAKGSHALRIDKVVPKTYQREKEHVALGRYHVTSRRESTKTVKAGDGQKRTVRHIELELTQVDEASMEPTRTSYTPSTVNITDLYGS